MPKIDMAIFEEILTHFTNINILPKQEIASSLAELTETYQNIVECLFTLLNNKEEALLSDAIITLILIYLKNRKIDDFSASAVSHVFSTRKITVLHTDTVKNRLHVIANENMEIFVSLMDEICFDDLLENNIETGYENILNIHLSWYDKNNRGKIEQLTKKLFKSAGLKHVTLYIDPDVLDINDINIINRIVEKPINEKDFLWKIFEKYFKQPSLELKKILLDIEVNIDDEYICLLNKILKKIDLGHEEIISKLLIHWVSKLGLQKLDKFSKKYLNLFPAGIELINKFDIDIDDQLIEDMNNCHDHVHLVTNLLNIPDNKIAKICVWRTRQIDETISRLEEQPLKMDRTKSNVDAMLANPCPLSLSSPISDTDTEAIIFIKKNSNPITFDDLNEKLCIILRPDCGNDMVCDKEAAQEWLNKKPPPIYPELSRALKKNDIVPFNDGMIDCEGIQFFEIMKRIDLDYLNRRFGLAPNINFSCTIQEKIAALNDLKNSQRLIILPEVFFTRNLLDLFPELNLAFIDDPCLLIYLNRVAIHIKTKNDITYLNKHMESLREYWKNISDVENILEKIPPVLLQINNIPLLIKLDKYYLSLEGIGYLNMAGSAITEISISKLNFLSKHKSELQKFQQSEIITLIEREYSFAAQSIENAIFIFENRIDNTLSDDEIINLLIRHQNDKKYYTFLLYIENHISNDCLTNKLSAPNNIILNHSIYRTYCLNANQSPKTRLFLAVKSIVKENLLNELNNKNIRLLTQAFISQYNEQLKKLEYELALFKKNNLYSNKRNQLKTRWFCRSDHLKVFLALQKAIDQGKNFFGIYKIINDNQDLLEKKDSLFSNDSSLLGIAENFISGVHIIFDIYLNENKNDADAFIAACLLDDTFYCFFTKRKNAPDETSHNYPATFFEILERYLPHELTAMTKNNSLIQSRYNNFLEKKKNFTKNSVKSLIERPGVKIPKRINMPPAYQLQDLDINVALSLLLSELENNREAKETLNGIVFIPLGPLEQGQKTNAANVLNMIKELTLNHLGKLCVGIFNINTNHYFLAILFTPPNAVTQIKIINPSYFSQDKKNCNNHIMELFKKLFDNQCQFVDKMRDSIQQYNDSDCGFACIETVRNIIQRNVISIVEQKNKDGTQTTYQLTINYDLLTLDAYRYVDHEDEFVNIAETVRKTWEERLSKQSRYYIQYPDGYTVDGGAYSFQDNKKLQSLINDREILISGIIKTFLEKHTLKLGKYFSQHPNIPIKIPDELITMVNTFISNLSSDQIAEITTNENEIREITAQYPSESINPNEDKIETKLFKQIQFVYCDEAYKRLDEIFIKYLNNRNPLSVSFIPLLELYNNFILDPNNRISNLNVQELISFFAFHHRNYFEHIKPIAEKHLYTVNQLRNTKSLPTANTTSTLAIKEHLINHLNSIISAFDKCTPRQHFVGLFNNHKILIHMKNNCIAWRAWLEKATNLYEIKAQQAHIATQLLTLIQSHTANPKDISNLIRVPLAHFLEVPEVQINRWNTERLVPSLLEQSSWIHSFFTSQSYTVTDKPGYTLLENQMKDRIKNLGVAPYDYAQKHVQYSDENELFVEYQQVSNFPYL